MVFSSPSTLWALGLLSIPIIIHLFQFRRYKRLYFSDTSLFHEIKAQSQTKNRLKHLLVLLSRLLFLSFLVMAFAQPTIPSASGNAEEPDLLSFYIDNSYSMTALGKNGSLLNEALEMAYRISDQYPEGTRVQLITNSLNASEKRTLSVQDFSALLDKIEPIGKHRDLAEVIAFQNQAINESSVKGVRSYLLSDFNASLPESSSPLHADSSRSYRLVQLKAESIENISVDSIWSSIPVHQKGITQTLYYRLTNHGEKALIDQKVDVYLNKRLISSPIVSIPPNQGLDSSFQFIPEQAGNLTGRIELQDQPISYDNRLHFTLQVADQIKVVEITDASKSSAFSRLFSGERYTHLSLSPDRLIQDSLRDAQLIIINGVEQWNLALTSISEQHLARGGNMLIIPPKDINEALRNEWNERFGWKLGNLDSVGSTVPKFNIDHPLFNGVFETVEEDMNMPKVNAAYEVLKGVGEIILPLPNQQLLLGSNKVQEGKVYFITSPLDKRYTNLTEHALFVPIMINLAVQSGLGTRLFYPIEAAHVHWNIRGVEQWRLQHEDGKTTFIPGLSYNGLLLNGQVESSGIYNLSEMGVDSIWTSFAFNHNRRESRLKAPSIDEVIAAFDNPEYVQVLENDTERLKLNIEHADLGTALWPWFILIALFFIGLEVVLLKLFKP